MSHFNCNRPLHLHPHLDAPLPTPGMLDNMRRTGNMFDDSWRRRPLQSSSVFPVKPLKSDFNGIFDRPSKTWIGGSRF